MRAPDAHAGPEGRRRRDGARSRCTRGADLPDARSSRWTKSGSSPVSEADIAVDHFLRERLTALAPDCGWLSEESEDDRARLGGPRLWIVDPIDGTRAFVNGRTDWSISVALVENGRPAIAALFVPMQDTLYLATAGEGATRQWRGGRGEQRRGRSTASRRRGQSRCSNGSATLRRRMIAEPKVFSLALRLARVAAGTLDLAFASNNSHDWDLAAADLLVHEAGGALTTFDGQQLTYNRADPLHGALVAAGRPRHEAFLELVRAKTFSLA